MTGEGRDMVRVPWRAMASISALGAAVVLAGCTSLLNEGTGAAAGIAGTAVANRMTNNATVATGIGLGVQAAAQAGLQYAERKVHAEEQDAIAQAAGPLDIGAVARWQVKHSVPIEDDEHGRVTVSRLIGGDGLNCKEVVFSVDSPKAGSAGAASQFFVTTICSDSGRWRWASAEPATARWGALQ